MCCQSVRSHHDSPTPTPKKNLPQWTAAIKNLWYSPDGGMTMMPQCPCKGRGGGAQMCFHTRIGPHCLQLDHTIFTLSPVTKSQYTYWQENIHEAPESPCTVTLNGRNRYLLRANELLWVSQLFLHYLSLIYLFGGRGLWWKEIHCKSNNKQDKQKI